MDDNQKARLAQLTNRATRYEITLTHTDGRQLLLTYGRKTRPGVLAYVNRVAVDLAAFTGSDYITLKDLPAGVFGQLGAWSIKASGRTEREAILGGELARWSRG